MKHNKFGDPQPKGHAEMVEALDERDVDDASALYAEISHDTDDDTPAEFRGYSAEVRHSDSGDEVFSTLGYEDRGDLVNDLKAAGITDVQDL